ncbi:MAG TPA: hypothetical protein VGI71_10635 [Scandinavium sp.]|jgi:hypothetical protein
MGRPLVALFVFWFAPPVALHFASILDKSSSSQEDSGNFVVAYSLPAYVGSASDKPEGANAAGNGGG